MRINKSKIMIMAFVITAIVISTTSCKKDSRMVKNQETKNIMENEPNVIVNSGQDYFKSIFFLNGSLTDDLPVLEDFKTYYSYTNNTQMLNSLSNIGDTIIYYIEADTLLTGYFDNFKLIIETGSAYQIEDLLGNAAEKIYNASLQINTYQDNKVAIDSFLTSLNQDSLIVDDAFNMSYLENEAIALAATLPTSAGAESFTFAAAVIAVAYAAIAVHGAVVLNVVGAVNAAVAVNAEVVVAVHQWVFKWSATSADVNANELRDLLISQIILAQ